MDISSLREREGQGALSVSELNGYIKSLFETNRRLSAVSVRGEISNFVNHRSGHLYFSLKDGESQIRCVMFRSSAQNLRFLPADGMKVTVRGSVNVYVRDGSYQIYVTAMAPDGIGALYLAYEQLKNKLFSEGLFDEERKKPIPSFPSTVGVITSPTGAAVRDIINITGRRFPAAKILLYPSLVQGSGAEENLVRALDYFDRTRSCDVVILGRGGGSFEDLNEFNGEKLARRIAVMTIPVISAVGHETDFTICDFVADLRAPTPSAAAELAVPDARELYLRFAGLSDRADAAINGYLDRLRAALVELASRPCLVDAAGLVSPKSEELAGLSERLSRAFSDVLQKKKNDLALLAGKLDALSPLATLSRGYAVAEKNGAVLKSTAALTPGDLVGVKLADGSFSATVNKIS